MPRDAARATELACDYLCIGAGTSTLGFVDVVLSASKDKTFIIVDKHTAPGGHWTMAYPFVTTHQPAGIYGVNSEPLGKKFENGRELLDIDDLATGEEIVAYYRRVMDKFVATGRVRYFPKATYDFEVKTFVTQDGERCSVSYGKLVTPESNVTVPSMRPPLFEVAAGRAVVKPVNSLPNEEHEHYVVLGGGKTGADAVLHLLKRGVPLQRLKWVVPRDAWFNLREVYVANGSFLGSTLIILDSLLQNDSSLAAFLAMERMGLIGRLDEEIDPDVMKHAIVTTDELHLLRGVQTVRLGRVRAVASEHIELERGQLPLENDTLLVDCTATAFASTRGDYAIFNPGHIRLSSGGTSLPSHSSARIGHLEATFETDAEKNAMFYLPQSAPGTGYVFDRADFIEGLYAELKTSGTFSAHPPSAKFLQNSRTEVMSMVHMTVPMIKSMSPALHQLRKQAKAFITKVEEEGWDDVPAKILGF